MPLGCSASKIVNVMGLTHFDLRSFVLSSLTIMPGLIHGGCVVVASHPTRAGDYDYDPHKLTSLDLCCPSLRSFSLLDCVALRCVTIEHRDPPPPPANGAAATTWASMATALEEVEIKGCVQLETLRLKGGSKAPRPTSPTVTTTVAVPRPPHRAPLAVLDVDQCPSLRELEVGEGWLLGPRAKRELFFLGDGHRPEEEGGWRDRKRMHRA